MPAPRVTSGSSGSAKSKGWCRALFRQRHSDVRGPGSPGGFEPHGRILEDERFAGRDPLAAHRFQEAVGGGLASRDVGSGQYAVDPACGASGFGRLRSADSQVGHRVVDIGPAARRNDPYPSALPPELAAEFPQRPVEFHRVEKRRIEFDFPQPQPFALGRVGDAVAAQEFVAPHSEIAAEVFFLGQRVARFPQRGRVGQRIGPPRVGQRAVEIQQNQFDRAFHRVSRTTACPTGRCASDAGIRPV